MKGRHFEIGETHSKAKMAPQKLSKLNHSVSGKVALISGGASGIGRATAHVFVDDGAKVAILDLGEDRVKAAVDEIVAAGYSADNVLGLVCNVRDNDRVKECVAEVVAKFGHIDIVVCCAGIGAVNAGYTVDAKEEDFWWVSNRSELWAVSSSLIRSAPCQSIYQSANLP